MALWGRGIGLRSKSHAESCRGLRGKWKMALFGKGLTCLYADTHRAAMPFDLLHPTVVYISTLP